MAVRCGAVRCGVVKWGEKRGRKRMLGADRFATCRVERAQVDAVRPLDLPLQALRETRYHVLVFDRFPPPES